MAIKKWEYKYCFLPVPIGTAFEDHLNQMGHEGWEVMAATFVDKTLQKTFSGPPGEPGSREIPTPPMCHIFFIAKRAAP